MTNYNIHYSYKVEEFGTTFIEADDREQAEEFAFDYVLETHPEAARLDIFIDTIDEVI